jgi:hypothetical protein
MGLLPLILQGLQTSCHFYLQKSDVPILKNVPQQLYLQKPNPDVNVIIPLKDHPVTNQLWQSHLTILLIL